MVSSCEESPDRDCHTMPAAANFMRSDSGATFESLGRSLFAADWDDPRPVYDLGHVTSENAVWVIRDETVQV